MNKLIYLSLILILISPFSRGQQNETELKKEVEVVKAYEPNISEVFKINSTPQIGNRETEKPAFEYTIKPRPVFSTFQVEPVQAAQMVGEPAAETGNGLLKLGVGNYKTPYGEAFFNTGAGERTTFGIHFRHLSSHGKVRLQNSDEVKAPVSEDQAEIFMNQFFKDSLTFKARLFFDRLGFRYYGYSGEKLSTTDKERLMRFWNEKQAFSTGGIELELKGKPQQGFGYDAGFKYQHFATVTGQKGNIINLGGRINKDFDLFEGRLDASVTLTGTENKDKLTGREYDNRRQAFVVAKPSVFFSTETAGLRLGINSYGVIDLDDDLKYLITPNIKASWSPAENWLTLYAGADGYMQQDHYLAIARENEFADPFHDVKNTRHRYILTAGILGKMTSRTSYKFQTDYSAIRDQHFYILKNSYLNTSGEDVLRSRSNTFDVVYDDMKQLEISGEFHYIASDLLNILVKGSYFSYDTEKQIHAWHQPDFESSASVYFTPEGPFTFTVDLYYIGERKALITAERYDENTQATQPAPELDTVWKLKPILDLNFGIEYQYAPKLSFWTKVNNFSAQKYDRWLGYTGKGVNLLLGLSYSF
ncbi:MAG: hypothetical protein AAGU19_19525 [Prolixibacteraceae bacterium]